MSTTTKQTPFEQALAQVEAKTLATPSVSVNGRGMDYFAYQLNVHLFNMKIMARGMKFKGITFTQIKKYYGLTGKSAKDCLPALQKIVDDYRTKYKLN